MAQRIPILMYHSIAEAVDAREHDICLSQAVFERQMEHLHEEGYSPVSLDLLAESIAGIDDLPLRPVAITFDDGYADNLTTALPVLQYYGFPATVFLVSGLVGASNAWDTAAGMPKRRLLSWDEVLELQRAGIAIGSHTVTHRRLPRLAHAAALEEIGESKRILEGRLGASVNHFSYPYGEMDGTVAAMVQEAGYRSACTTMSGFNGVDADPFALRRLDIYGTDTLPRFARKLAYGSNDGRLLTSMRYYGRRIFERTGLGW